MSELRARAAQRREMELRRLAINGVPVTVVSRWHYSIGDVHIWPSAGRWQNEKSGQHGRLNGVAIARLLQKQSSGNGIIEGELKPDQLLPSTELTAPSSEPLSDN